MFVVDVICCPSIGRPVYILDLQVNGSVFRFCLVSMPSEPTTEIGFPPLDPIVGSLSVEIEFDPKTRASRCVLALEKRDRSYLSDDFVGVASGRFVPDSVTSTGSRETVVDAAKEFRLQRAPHTEDGRHR